MHAGVKRRRVDAVLFQAGKHGGPRARCAGRGSGVRLAKGPRKIQPGETKGAGGKKGEGLPVLATTTSIRRLHCPARSRVPTVP